MAAGLFVWRFRLPFAYLPLASTVAGFAVVLVWAADLGFLILPVLLFAGVATFAAAMSFDLSDMMRTSRASDNGFWLHLAAAPLITHALVALLLPEFALAEGWGMALILVLFVIASLVALVIDRRALLVAMLSYLGFAVAALLGKIGVSGGGLVALALLIVGALVVMLGVGWRPLRARAVNALVPAEWLELLPPVERST